MDKAKEKFFEVDLQKLRVLAKPSHNTCRGTGVAGVVRGTNIHHICPCVWRALRRRGVADQDMEKHIEKNPPSVEV